MKQAAWIFFLLLFCSPSLAGTRQEEPPNREMLRLMELLKNWEVIKELELMRQLEKVEQTEEPAAQPAIQTGRRGTTKDKQK